jgi:hypothetical protein
MRDDGRVGDYFEGRTREDYLRSLPPDMPPPGGTGSDWAIRLMAGGIGGVLKTYLAPLAAIIATLYILAAPWWAEIYLIGINAAALYTFFQNRALPDATVKAAIPVKLHVMAIVGGAVGTEVGRWLFSDPVHRRPLRWSVFLGSVLIIWAVSSHDGRRVPSSHAAPATSDSRS